MEYKVNLAVAIEDIERLAAVAIEDIERLAAITGHNVIENSP